MVPLGFRIEACLIQYPNNILTFLIKKKKIYKKTAALIMSLIIEKNAVFEIGVEDDRKRENKSNDKNNNK